MATFPQVPLSSPGPHWKNVRSWEEEGDRVTHSKQHLVFSTVWREGSLAQSHFCSLMLRWLSRRSAWPDFPRLHACLSAGLQAMQGFI